MIVPDSNLEPRAHTRPLERLTCLVVPASAACTFLTNAIAAKLFLYEKVDRRRWIAAIFVGAGVALLAQ